MKVCSSSKCETLFAGTSCYPISPLRATDDQSDEASVDQEDQLLKILGIVDTYPTDKTDVQSSYLLQMINQLEEKKSLASMFKDAPRDYVKLLEVMLSFDPKERLSAKELLQNPIFDPIRNKSMERGCP